MVFKSLIETSPSISVPVVLEFSEYNYQSLYLCLVRSNQNLIPHASDLTMGVTSDSRLQHGNSLLQSRNAIFHVSSFAGAYIFRKIQRHF